MEHLTIPLLGIIWFLVHHRIGRLEKKLMNGFLVPKDLCDERHKRIDKLCEEIADRPCLRNK